MATQQGGPTSGQVATSTGTIGGPYAAATEIQVLFFNINSATQTVNYFYLPSGGSALQIGQCQLAQWESQLVTGIALNAGDAFQANTTTGSACNYYVKSFAQQAFVTQGVAATGASKGSTSGISGNQVATGKISAKEFGLTPQPADTFAATMTIDVTYGSHIVAASNGTSATCAMTPSAAGTAGDVLTIITEADSSGTVTTTFASTFHSSGTQATTASHNSSVMFMSDGTKWIEICRTTALS